MLCFVSILCSSQERVNNPGVTFDKVGKKFTNAIGWAYNSSLERWIDYKNTICTSLAFKRSRVSEVGTSNMKGFTSKNFTSITCKSFVFKGERFYALFVSNWDKIEIYLFNHNYENIFTVEDDVPHELKGICLVEGKDTWYESREDWTDEEYAFYLANNWENWIDNPYSKSEQNVFHYQKYGDNMRFLIDKTLRFDWFYFETPLSNFSILLP